MSIFKRINEEKIGTMQEEMKDSSGMSFISEAGVYELVVNRAWGIQSEGGAIGVHVEFEGEGLWSTDLYATNREQDTFYVDKKTGKKMSLPTYITVKKMNYIATLSENNSLANIKSESRIVKTKEWKEVDGERKQVEVEKEVDFMVDWQGKTMNVALQQIEALDKDKNPVKNKDGNQVYNLEILNIFNADKLSASEMLSGATETKAYDSAKARLEKSPVKKTKAKQGTTNATTATKKVNPFA
jgi:hypothetical protein